MNHRCCKGDAAHHVAPTPPRIRLICDTISRRLALEEVVGFPITLAVNGGVARNQHSGEIGGNQINDVHCRLARRLPHGEPTVSNSVLRLNSHL